MGLMYDFSNHVDVVTNASRAGTDVIYDCQSCVDLTPNIRKNTDFLIFTRTNILTQQQKIWQIIGCPLNCSTFGALFRWMTEDFNVLVVDMRHKQPKLYWYRADNIEREFNLDKEGFTKHMATKKDEKTAKAQTSRALVISKKRRRDYDDYPQDQVGSIKFVKLDDS